MRLTYKHLKSSNSVVLQILSKRAYTASLENVSSLPINPAITTDSIAAQGIQNPQSIPTQKRKRRIISPITQKPLEEKLELLKPYFGVTPTLGEAFPLERDQIVQLLELQDTTIEQTLFDYANSITEAVYGKKVFFRGIIEFSNVCEKDCYYCGIRKHMKVHRYTMTKDEIVEQALWANKNQFGSIMLQSGEVTTQKRIDFLCDVIREIKNRTKSDTTDSLGVSISLGELTREQYAQLLEAGAHRYLLRIETSNPQLYKKLHPEDHYWERRDECIKDLRELGYQIGTGVMIQLPFQTTQDLANDILYCKDRKVDMVGMGPYIVQDDTPLGKIWREQHSDSNFDMKEYNKQLFRTSLKMIALSRIVCKTPNIAATTALQAINPAGREIALMSGGL